MRSPSLLAQVRAWLPSAVIRSSSSNTAAILTGTLRRVAGDRAERASRIAHRASWIGRWAPRHDRAVRRAYGCAELARLSPRCVWLARWRGTGESACMHEVAVRARPLFAL